MPHPPKPLPPCWTFAHQIFWTFITFQKCLHLSTALYEKSAVVKFSSSKVPLCCLFNQNQSQYKRIWTYNFAFRARPAGVYSRSGSGSGSRSSSPPLCFNKLPIRALYISRKEKQLWCKYGHMFLKFSQKSKWEKHNSSPDGSGTVIWGRNYFASIIKVIWFNSIKNASGGWWKTHCHGFIRGKLSYAFDYLQK